MIALGYEFKDVLSYVLRPLALAVEVVLKEAVCGCPAEFAEFLLNDANLKLGGFDFVCTLSIVYGVCNTGGLIRLPRVFAKPMSTLLQRWPWILLAYFLIVAPVGLLYVLVRAWEHHHRKRRSPLTRMIPRQAGHTLRLRALDIQHEVVGTAIFVFIAPLLAGTMAYCMQEPLPRFPPTIGQGAIVVMTGCVAMFFLVRLWKRMDEARRIHLGLDGEVFVGAALNRLSEVGCRVFHDVTLSHGNVDHVVVSQSGVFAVETKMIGKESELTGQSTVVVDYEQNQLRFPHRTDRIPTKQAIQQGEILARELTSAVGEPVFVEPILALPGWKVERKGRGSVMVINPVNAEPFFVNRRNVLSPQLIQRIAHQLEQMTTDVEPVYRKSSGWRRD